MNRDSVNPTTAAISDGSSTLSRRSGRYQKNRSLYRAANLEHVGNIFLLDNISQFIRWNIVMEQNFAIYWTVLWCVSMKTSSHSRSCDEVTRLFQRSGKDADWSRYYYLVRSWVAECSILKQSTEAHLYNFIKAYALRKLVGRLGVNSIMCWRKCTNEMYS